MDCATLAKLLEKANCRVCGWEDAANEPQRNVLAVLIEGFNHPDATILCEPSLARKTTRPPDALLIDPIAGVHLIEVKGYALDQIEGIERAGLLKVRYYGGLDTKSPIAQVRKAMFDIKNAAEQAAPSDLTLHFKYWVVFPSISRASWFGRWGSDAYAPPEFLFTDDLFLLADKIRTDGRRNLANKGLSQWPADQFAFVWRAFGDSSVLYQLPEEREPRRVPVVSISYQQRTGKSLPGGAVEVTHYNGLLYRLSKKGLWRYQPIGDMREDARVKLYLQLTS
jgi:hypothetical protein